jgi:N-acetylmuramoyl-L-alanine amidase
MGLVAVAALFSAGAWWGMQGHGKTAVTKVTAAQGDARIETIKTSPRSVTTPAAPADDVLAPAVADNLMNPEKLVSDAAPLTAVPEDKLAALPKITGVRHWTSSMGSTVVIDMEDQVPYEVHRLMSPERIYFDLHDTALSAGLDGKAMDVGDASLTRVRVAQPVAGVTRVVLDTRDGSNFSVSMESNPYRLVVELRASEKTSVASHFAANRSGAITSASLDTAPASKAAPVASLTAKGSEQVVPVKAFPARTGKTRIVLDAGHGGWDLGTVGREGLLEKDLVLDVTQRLGKLLQARLGAEVMFTRTDDTYLPLEQRADVANQAQADLFVSVHANYSSSATARGVETYYTNLFSAPGSHEVERHEDGTFAKLTPVSLTAGGLHEKIEESRRLATSVQRALYATLSATSPDIRNRGIKDSAFAVLTGTTMPAILTEISFVSSPADERNLQSATYRQQIAEALYQGIARYQQSAPRARVAQLQTTAARR